MDTWAIALLVGFAIGGAVLAVVGLIQAPAEPPDDLDVGGTAARDGSAP
jgi:hypothetical protein